MSTSQDGVLDAVRLPMTPELKRMFTRVGRVPGHYPEPGPRSEAYPDYDRITKMNSENSENSEIKVKAEIDTQTQASPDCKLNDGYVKAAYLTQGLKEVSRLDVSNEHEELINRMERLSVVTNAIEKAKDAQKECSDSQKSTIPGSDVSSAPVPASPQFIFNSS